MKYRVSPAFISGEIVAPPSKSESHRLAILSSLSNKRTTVHNISLCKDVLITIDCLKQIGAKLEIKGNNLEVYSFNKRERASLYAGESGTSLRFFIAICSALNIKAKITGESSLLSRPNDDLINCLIKNGAKILFGNDGFLIEKGIKAGDFYLDASLSSQYLSAMLIALSLLDGESRLYVSGKIVSKDYAHITIDCLQKFGIILAQSNNCFCVKAKKLVPPKNIIVGGDYSSASTFLCMGAINGDVKVFNLQNNSLQGDKRIVDVLKKMNVKIVANEKYIAVSKSDIKGTIIDCEDIPDLALNLAVVGAYASGTTTLTNLSRLKDKECDRLKAILDMLTVAKIEHKLKGNDLTIYGGKLLSGIFNSCNDHRVFMAEVMIGCSLDSDLYIVGEKCVDKSYPLFFDDYKKLGGKIDVSI